ncbi:MAG: (d)CMP kinase [Firmicutes bacterium]|nr:(d)CMP kinase [Bacillota bacterium]
MKARIAIDGPAGAGKSTVARAVAKRLNLTYLDTGAMYRAVTLAALRNGTDLHDQKALEALTLSLQLDIQTDDKGNNIVFLNGEDVTTAIRDPLVNRHVSIVALYPEVRRLMVQKQREISKRGGVVMDGRDIGTHVMPDAEYKFFLTASLEERAKRRQAELQAAGKEISYEQVLEEIAARDKIDSEREHSPLRAAKDAILIDTTELSVAEVVDTIIKKVVVA